MSMNVFEFDPNLVLPGCLNWYLTLGEYLTGDGLLNPVDLKRSSAFENALEGELASLELS